MKNLAETIREDRERAATRRGSTKTERAAATKQFAQILNRSPGLRVVGLPSAYGFPVDIDGRWFRVQVMPS